MDNTALIPAAGSSNLQFGAFSFMPTSLVIRGTPTLAECHECLVTLRRLAQGVSWWIGDLLAYADARYGEKYAQIVDGTGYDIQTLANAAYVARHVAPAQRRATLPYGLHAEVAALAPDEQERILADAERDGLTRDEVRARAAAARDGEAAAFVQLWRRALREATQAATVAPAALREDARVVVAAARDVLAKAETQNGRNGNGNGH